MPRRTGAPGWLIELVLDAARVPPSSSVTEVRLVIGYRGLAERWHCASGGLPLMTFLSGARDLYAALGLPGSSWPWRPPPSSCAMAGPGARLRCASASNL